jgi:hypothetical protein
MRVTSAFAAFALLLESAPAATQPTPPSGPDQPDPMRCAATRAEAATLRHDVDGRLQRRVEGDVFIAYDDVANRRIWMFTTQAHPAHPSVVCIEIVRRNDAIGADVQVGCFSSAANCANLNRELEERGARVRQALSPH